MSTFPVPPDVRTSRDFNVERGTEEMFREDKPIAAAVTMLDQGEWVGLTNGEIVKAGAGDVLATPLQGARVCWTRFRRGDTWNGQGDAAALAHATLLSGSYKAATKLFDDQAQYNNGDLLVVITDGNLVNARGILAPVTPAAATARQVASAVGKVDGGVVDGVLRFSAVAT